LESIVRFWFLVFFTVWATSSTAVEVKNLYVAEVSVVSQSPEERNKAIRSALAEVLVKVTGNRAILGEDAAQEIINKGPRYVRQYSYFDESHSAEPEDKEADQRKLRVRFDPFALNEALRSKGFSIWAEERPVLLAWIAIDNGKKRYLLDLENHPKLTKVFQQAAEKRGLPLLLPLMDLVDQGAVSFNDIWGDFDDRIKQASERYDTAAILSGRLLKKSARSWRAEWTLYQQDDVVHWDYEASSASAALASGMDGTLDLFVERYVTTADLIEWARYKVRVSSVSSLDDFAWLSAKIKALPLVEAIEWSELKSDSVQFNVTVKGDEQALRKALDSVGRLLAEEEGDEGEEPTGELFYQMQP
jgi:hypothetical protein